MREEKQRSKENRASLGNRKSKDTFAYKRRNQKPCGLKK